jgi:molybdopterin-guanine dinucleotide biosynthesis protein B
MSKMAGFSGYSNSGKTTVISDLIGIMKKRGLRVAAVKHASHGYQVDTPGKDSWQHFEAGADRVVLIGPESMTTHQRWTAIPPLREIFEEMTDVDIVLIEGFKQQIHPQILVYRKEGGKETDYPPGDYSAVISDTELPLDIPQFAFNELERAADFIIDLLK